MTAATTPEERWLLGYRPALDGLRGIAVLLVMASHALVPFSQGGGWIGVTIFFVLSGFLITRLLLEEKDRTGSISFMGFYKRRLRRLGPALVALVVITLAVSLLFVAPQRAILQAGAALSYSANWIYIAAGDLGPYGHTWTLAIEEQFYLVWPAIVVGLAVLRRRYAVAILLIGVLVSIVARSISPEARAVMGTDTRADALLVGAIAALCVDRVRVPAWAVVGAGGLLGAVMLFEPNGFGLTFGLTLAPPLIAVVVLGVLERPVGLDARWLRGVGRISYGLYLWHFAPMLYLRPFIEPWPVRAGVLFAIAFVLALASWHLVERPFLRNSRKARRSLLRVERVSSPASR